MVFDEPTGPAHSLVPVAEAQATEIDATAQGIDLLQPLFRSGVLVGEREPLAKVRERATSQLRTFRDSTSGSRYPVGLEPRLHRLKTELVEAARSP